MSYVNPRHACAGKQRHPSQGKAEAHIRSLIEREGPTERNQRMEAYPCHWCKAWHVGRKRRVAA